jgi:chromosome segregation ATPase
MIIKKTILQLAVTIFITPIILTACQSVVDKEAAGAKQNVAEAKVDSAKFSIDNLAQEQRDSLTLLQQFKKRSEERINENKKIIADLKIRIANSTEDVKAGYQKTIDELEQKNEDLKSRLADFKDNQKEKLEDFKQKINDEISKISKSLKEIKIK